MWRSPLNPATPTKALIVGVAGSPTRLSPDGIKAPGTRSCRLSPATIADSIAVVRQPHRGPFRQFELRSLRYTTPPASQRMA
jgi:hypothetical protein